jgi:hypothetical protein
LLVGLARTLYNPRPGEQIGGFPDPAELCDTARFPTRVAIQEYLFDAFIPAAYRPHPDPARRCSWTSRQAERWLVFLARHLEQDFQGRTDFAWWELHQAVSGRRLALIAGLTGGLAVGLAAGLVGGLVGGLEVGLARGLVDGLIGGLVVGLMFKLEPATTPARGWGWKPHRLSGLLSGLVIGLVLGLLFGLVSGLVVGLVVGLASGLTLGFMDILVGMPGDLTVTTEPQAALTRDRSTSWTLGLVVGLAGAPAAWLVSGPMGGLARGLADALAAGLIFGLAVPTVHTAWGRFVGARCWLALQRRLPWRLMSFLADAHMQRGVLRQAGAVYQFRHVDLQRRLATRPAA